MLDSTRYPSVSTAAAVSSHELSIPNTTIRALPPKSAPGAENTKGGGTTPTAFALRPLPGRRLCRGGSLRLRLARVRTLLLDQSHGLDDVERALQLRILLEILHRVGRGQRPVLRHGLLRRLHHDVRRDALAVDRAALRREVLRGGQPQARAVGQRNDRLHGALAEGLRPHDHGAAP